jgi:hypothetical protein
MAISEITPSAVKIDKLISRVSETDIKIPAFQRHFDPEANANLQTFNIFFDLDSREFRATTDLVPEHRSFPLKVLFELRHADPRITLGIYGHVIGDA